MFYPTSQEMLNMEIQYLFRIKFSSGKKTYIEVYFMTVIRNIQGMIHFLVITLFFVKGNVVKNMNDHISKMPD